MKSLLIGLLLFCSATLFAQPAKDSSWKKEYRESATRINDLVHTNLDLRPDFTKNIGFLKSLVNPETAFLCNRFTEPGCKRNGH